MKVSELGVVGLRVLCIGKAREAGVEVNVDVQEVEGEVGLFNVKGKHLLRVDLVTVAEEEVVVEGEDVVQEATGVAEGGEGFPVGGVQQ